MPARRGFLGRKRVSTLRCFVKINEEIDGLITGAKHKAEAPQPMRLRWQDQIGHGPA